MRSRDLANVTADSLFADRSTACQKLTLVYTRTPLLPLLVGVARQALVQAITNEQIKLDAEKAAVGATQKTTTIKATDTDDSSEYSDGEGEGKENKGTDRLRDSPYVSDTEREQSHEVATVGVTQSIESDEPILGNWLEDLLSNVPALVDEEMRKRQGQLARRRSTVSEALATGPLRDTFPTEKKLLNVCREALVALNTHLLDVGSASEALHSAVTRSVSMETVGHLADMLLRLYFHHSHDNNNQKEFAAVDTELSRVIHNALANKYIKPRFQKALIYRLIEHDLAEGTEWPLWMPPPALAVLGQTLMLRLHDEQVELGCSDAETTVVNIWTRFLNCLLDTIRKGLEIDADTLR